MTWIRQILLPAALCLVLLPGAGFGQAQDEAIRVFLDCQTHCDTEHLRREITYVNWVRDRQDAVVHLLITSQGTGGGGQEYTLQLMGLRDFQGVNDEIKFSTRQTDTGDEVRRALTQRIALGLGRYVARGGLAERVRVTFVAPPGGPPGGGGPAQQPRDPWNLWVFRVSANGFLAGESQSKQNDISGSVRADRVSETWKFRISAGANRSHSEFTLSDSTVFKSTNSRYNASSLLVRSLGDHWSLGTEANALRSTRENYDLTAKVMPGIEYNVFPYRESSRRQLVLVYQVGLSYANYQDTTIYNKLVETRPLHRFVLAAEAVQPWGSVDGSLNASSYLDDFATNRVSVFGSCSIRLVRGLNLNVYGSYSRVRDQLSLLKAGASDEEILLRLKQIKTSYYYSGSIGLSYTFGSKFNNIVNPRFGNAGGGGNCFCSGGSCFCS